MNDRATRDDASWASEAFPRGVRKTARGAGRSPRVVHVVRAWFRRRPRGGASRGRVVVFGAKGFPRVAAAGGVERGVEHLTTRLGRLGISCIVYERAPRAGWRRAGRTLVRQLPFVDRKNHAFWSHAILSVLDYLAYRRPADVLHIHNIPNAFLCVIFCALGHRVVFHVHGQEWRVAKWGRGMSLFMRLSILPMLLCADVVVTVCDESRRLLTAKFPWAARRIVCVPNGLPDPACPSSVKDTFLTDSGLVPRRFFLYAGRLVPQKRVELIIQALRVSDSDCALVIAGTASHSAAYVRALESEVRRCGFADRVRFVGQLGWEQLLCLYLNCRAVVHPSDSEGCSNTVLEAIASAACVVCSDLPENRALLGDAALYVAPGDAVALATVLRALESSETVAHRQRLVAAQQRQLRSWDDIVQEFLRLYWPMRVTPHVAGRHRHPSLLDAAGTGTR